MINDHNAIRAYVQLGYAALTTAQKEEARELTDVALICYVEAAHLYAKAVKAGWDTASASSWISTALDGAKRLLPANPVAEAARAVIYDVMMMLEGANNA